MKRLPTLAGTVGLFTILLCSPSFAQRDRDQDRDKGKQGDDEHGRGRNYPAQRSKGEARGWQKQPNWRQNAWQPNNSWDQHRAKEWQNEHRTWTQRGGYGGFYIDRNRFDRSFGPQHVFRLRTRPSIVGGYPRFQYGGYTFMMVDPYPEGWGPDWYNTDDVYVDYNGDGYYLYDRRDPGFGIALSIVM